MSEIKVNTITKRTGSTLTIGESGTTVALASGASQSGFKAIDWQSVVTADGSTTTTAEAGKGYPIDTTSAAHTINLPASPSAGDEVAVLDYAGTFATYNLTIGRNGSNIQGGALNATISTTRRAITLVYIDSTKGWIPTNDNTTEDYGSSFIEATGGTTTTSGNFKIHTFNSSGNFVVSSLSAVSANNDVSYLVSAGAGGGGAGASGSWAGGGGGGGGFREGRASNDSYTVSPLNAPAGITVTTQTYPITVGGGGNGATGPSGTNKGSTGSNSVFSTITSAGGGGGGAGANPGSPGDNGGSGGGGGSGNDARPGGTGNTPPVSPSQGNDGGDTSANHQSGSGGGGATAAGTSSVPGGGSPRSGGAGASSVISGSSTTYSTGGASGNNPGPGPATAGAANTGIGGQGAWGAQPPYNGGAGGSGVVVIRYKYQ